MREGGMGQVEAEVNTPDHLLDEHFPHHSGVQGNVDFLEFADGFFWKPDHFCLFKEGTQDAKESDLVCLFLAISR